MESPIALSPSGRHAFIQNPWEMRSAVGDCWASHFMDIVVCSRRLAVKLMRHVSFLPKESSLQHEKYPMHCFYLQRKGIRQVNGVLNYKFIVLSRRCLYISLRMDNFFCLQDLFFLLKMKKELSFSMPRTVGFLF